MIVVHFVLNILSVFPFARTYLSVAGLEKEGNLKYNLKPLLATSGLVVLSSCTIPLNEAERIFIFLVSINIFGTGKK